MLTATDVVSATGGRLIRGDPHQPVAGVSIDSRTIRPGELFVAIRGERFDGHQFIYDALNRGGCGAMVQISVHRMPATEWEEMLLRNKILIGVVDTVAALQDWARHHRQQWGRPVAAVTGSNGKTTTKEMAAAILSERYDVLKNEGNLNNQIGVPLTLLRLAERHAVAVVEMGINRPGEMGRLGEIAIPGIGLITNIGPAHLERLGRVEAVASAKAELLQTLSPSGGVAILNRDDPFYAYLRSRAMGAVVTFGLGPDADLRADGVEEKDGRLFLQLSARPSAFERDWPGLKPGPGFRGPSSVEVALPWIGRYNALNAAAAAALGLILGCDLAEAKRGLEKLRPVAMRSELITWEGRTILNDAYNANPASMRAALETLSRFEGSGRRIAVLGDMLELGDAAPEAHREIGQAVVSSGVDFLIALGPQAERIAEGALARGMRREAVVVCREPAEAAERLKGMARAGDVILIKGSRGMRMERILDHLGLRR